MTHHRRVVTALTTTLVLLCSVVAPGIAHAQSPSDPPAPAAESSPKMEEAKERFNRGLKLYQDANYEAARVEFERAYALAPTYKLLYNIGYCYRQLNDYVAAIRALDRFLAEGGGEVPADRRQEVTTTLDDLRARIATISITTNVPGATISIDDVPVGSSPLKEPVTVNPGRRKVSASEKGGSQATQIVTVAGREQAQVNLELSGPRTIVVEKKGTNILPYVAWGVTGLLVVGTVVAGIVTLGAESDQQDLLRTAPAPRAGQSAQDAAQEHKRALDDARTTTSTAAAVTDIFLVSAILGAGVATYVTLKARSDAKSEKSASSSVRAAVAGPSLLLRGEF